MESLNSQSNNTKKEISKNAYSVNPSAELIINILATVLLFLGIIVSAISIVGGIAYIDMGLGITAYGISIIAGGMIIFIVSIVQWAWFKIIINISRNLFNINEQLKYK